MLSNEFPRSVVSMSTTISRDFRFPDLKFLGKNDLVVHIAHFINMTKIQGLTEAHRCKDFPLTLVGRARE